MKRVSLLILACILSACSDTGNPYTAPGAPGAPGKPGNPTAPGSGQDKNEVQTGQPGGSALTATAWCAPWHNQGRDWQFRLSLSDLGTFETRIYSLINGGGRGAEVPEWGTHGNYEVRGASFTMMDSNGQTNSYTLRLDPADAVTGAKKLHLTNAQGDAAFDPCI